MGFDTRPRSGEICGDPCRGDGFPFERSVRVQPFCQYVFSYLIRYRAVQDGGKGNELGDAIRGKHHFGRPLCGYGVPGVGAGD